MGLEETLLMLEWIAKILLAGISIIGGLLIHLKSRKLEKSGRRYFLLGIAVFGYIFGLTRILFLYTDHLRETLGATDPTYLFLWKLGYMISLLAITAIVVVIEKYMMKTKYIFTVTAIVGMVLTVILAIETVRYFNPIILGVLLLDVLAAYSYVAIKSEGEPRKRALLSFLGLALLAVGILLDGFTDQIFGMNLSVMAISIVIVGLLLYWRMIYTSKI